MSNPLYHSHEGYDEEPSITDIIIQQPLDPKLVNRLTEPPICPMDLCDDGSSRNPLDCSCKNERGLGLFEQPMFEDPKDQEELRKEQEEREKREREKRFEAWRKAHMVRDVITNSKTGESRVVYGVRP